MRSLAFCIAILTVLYGIIPAYAGPTDGTYELVEYGFGSGGTDGSGNGTHSLNGILGELNAGTASNGTLTIGDGLIFTMLANVPPAPSFTNPSNNYDRLLIILDNGNNPADTEFAIAISTDNFTTTNYIQSDNTVGSILSSEDWQTYTNWGAGTGEYVTGLAAGTEYKIKVKARQGNYTETGYGPEATITTSEPTLSFGVSSSSVTFDNLNSVNSYTDLSKSTVLTTSTNAYNGYVVYGRVTAVLTSGSSTISNYASPNSSPTTWTGTGFGYTTNDNNLAGGTANRFTNGGPNYAGFTTSAPGDPVADHAGPVTTAISNEEFTVSYRVTADANTKAGSYTTNVIYVIVPTY